MQVTFYKFAKRVNSTKRPSGGVTKDCLFKEKTDLHAPTVKCAASESETLAYNYMKIGDHYYWIVQEVVMPAGWIEWTGELDPMATCADEIKATTAFIERSASLGTTTLLDSLAPAQSNDKTTLIGDAPVSIFSGSEGSYIVTVANYPSPMIMNNQQFQELYEQLNSESVINQLENSIVRLEEIITGAIWIPVPRGLIFTQGEIAIKAGFVDTGIVGDTLLNEPITTLVGIGSYLGETILDSSAYKSLYLYLPFVGAVELSPDQFKGAGVVVEVSLDPTNGALMYKIENSAGAVIATYNGSCGIPIPIGSTSYNVGGAVATAIGIAGSIATGNVLGAIASGTALMFSGLKSVSSIGGGGGSRAGMSRISVSLYAITRTPPEGYSVKSAVAGLPTYRTAQLGSLNGFVKCYNASIESAQEGSVIEACNNYLNSGAYIE